MESKQTKYNLRVITSEMYHRSPNRYELRKGTEHAAPNCPFGNRFEWIGFDKEKREYVRVTKSVFKRLIKELEDIDNF